MMIRKKKTRIVFPANEHKGSDIWVVGVVAAISLALLTLSVCIAIYLYYSK